MDYSYQRNLRRTILQCFYETSKGSHLNFVNREALAEKLGFLNQSDSDFHSALTYLKDKFFIKVRDSINSSITTEGIDEVESGYTTLPGVSIFEDDGVYIQFNLLNIHKKIAKLLEKDKQGILKGKELYEFETKVIEQIKDTLQKASEEDRLLFEKVTPCFRNEPKSDFVPANYGKEKLEIYTDFISKKIEEITGEAHKTERYIEPGKSFTARSHLRSILRLANQYIFIVDAYPGIEILDILLPFFEDNRSLELEILTSNKKDRKKENFIKDLGSFASEFSINPITCRETDQIHDRFIILDNEIIYGLGNSFDNICKAEKASHIKKIEDNESAETSLRDIRKI